MPNSTGTLFHAPDCSATMGVCSSPAGEPSTAGPQLMAGYIGGRILPSARSVDAGTRTRAARSLAAAAAATGAIVWFAWSTAAGAARRHAVNAAPAPGHPTAAAISCENATACG